MIKKLQIKFIAINMTIVTIMLTVIFGLMYHFTQKNLELESVRMMKAVAAGSFLPGTPKEETAHLKLPFFIVQLSINGELVSANSNYYDVSDHAFLKQLIAECLEEHQESGILKQHHLRYFCAKFPMGTILVFSDTSSEDYTLKHLLRSFAMIGLFSFFAFLTISIFLSRWAVKPVADAWQKQKQFVADASHELKTPLTVIMTNTQLLCSTPYTNEEQAHFLHNISIMSQQMKQLIEKMLLLAKSDQQETALCMKPFDLSRLVCDCTLSFEGIFLEKELSLESNIAQNITVIGNEESLKQVIEILLDNAQKYSTEHGTTTISFFAKGHRKCCLTVSNPGIPIPKEELNHIFQRFYRMDSARNCDGSFGLGLSIAQNIVTQHKGKIWAKSEHGINSFFVELNC